MCGVRSKVVLLHVLYTERIPGPTVSYRNRHVFATIYSHHIPALSSGNRTFPADARCCTSRQVFPAALKGSLASCRPPSLVTFVWSLRQNRKPNDVCCKRPPPPPTEPRHKLLCLSSIVNQQYHRFGFVAKSLLLWAPIRKLLNSIWNSIVSMESGMFFTRVTYLKGWMVSPNHGLVLLLRVKNIDILSSYRQKTPLWLCIRMSDERGRGITVWNGV